jgi:hypothetical protein
MAKSRSQKENPEGGGQTSRLLRQMEADRVASQATPSPSPAPSSVFIWPSGPPTPLKDEKK